VLSTPVARRVLASPFASQPTRFFTGFPLTMSRYLALAVLAMVRPARPARARMVAPTVPASRRINAPLDPARFPA
jgi:hypothetical protein